MRIPRKRTKAVSRRPQRPGPRQFGHRLRQNPDAPRSDRALPARADVAGPPGEDHHRARRNAAGPDREARPIDGKEGPSALRVRRPQGRGQDPLPHLLVHRIESQPELAADSPWSAFPKKPIACCRLPTSSYAFARFWPSPNGDGRVAAALCPNCRGGRRPTDHRYVGTAAPRWREDTGRMLLVFWKIWTRFSLGKSRWNGDLHRLRSFLMTSPSCILVATSPLTFPGLTDVGSPFYDFFDIQVLDNLTQQQTVDAIRRNLEYDGRDGLAGAFRRAFAEDQGPARDDRRESAAGDDALRPDRRRRRPGGGAAVRGIGRPDFAILPGSDQRPAAAGAGGVGNHGDDPHGAQNAGPDRRAAPQVAPADVRHYCSGLPSPDTWW